MGMVLRLPSEIGFPQRVKIFRKIFDNSVRKSLGNDLIAFGVEMGIHFYIQKVPLSQLFVLPEVETIYVGEAKPLEHFDQAQVKGILLKLDALEKTRYWKQDDEHGEPVLFLE